MPTSAGPDIAGESNLVFSYDTGDINNSYKGEPATNLITSGLPGYFGSGGQTLYQSSLYGLNSDSGVFQRNYVTSPNSGNNGGLYKNFTTSALNAATRYVQISFDFYMITRYRTFSSSGVGLNGYIGITNTDSTTDTYGWDTRYSNGSGDDWSNDEAYVGRWQKVSLIAALRGDKNPASINAMYIYYDFLTQGEGIFTNFIITEHVTLPTGPVRYTEGTRSATQGLNSLVGNPTIDLSRVSFDSSAQLVFDGTDDTISVPSYSEIELVDNVSIEYVYMRLSTDPILDVIANKYHGTGWELFCQTGNTFALAGRNGDGTYYSTTNAAYTIQNNKYYHLVAIKEGLSWRLYVNGELYASLTANSIGTWSNSGVLQIGGEGSGYFPNMKLPVFKIYNRVLSSSEISRNFNSIQSKFNILGSGNSSADSSISAKTIKQLNSSSTNGYYWIKPPQLTNPIQAYCDMTTDGGGWTKFWWYNGKGWPSGLHALDYAFGTHNQGGDYGFQRLPQYLTKDNTELLAKDGAGNVYKWDFANASETSQRVWNSLFSGTEGAWAEGGAFNPTILAGSSYTADQDSWQYRTSEGVKSFMLDDDTCDCNSTINAGHAMCGGSGWSQDYAQPYNAYLRYGVDILPGGGCNGPLPINSLELYFREKN